MTSILLLAILLSQPASLPEQIQKAQAEINQGDLQAAEQTIQGILQEHPDRPGPYYLLGSLRFRQGRLAEAEQMVQKSLSIEPRFLDAYLLLAGLYRNQGRGEEMMATLQRGHETLPNAAAITFQIASEYAAQGGFRESLAYLEKISPDSAPKSYWNLLGQNHVVLGNLNQADVAFQKYLEMDSTSVRTLRRLAAISLQKDDISAAWKYISEARRLAPNSTQVLFDFAHISMLENLVGEAAAALQFLLLMQPDHAQALFELGSAFIHFANFEASQGLFAQYVELEPEDAQGYAMLGYVLYLGSQFDEAKDPLTRALKMNPELLDAKFYLGMIAYSLGQNEEAEQLLKEVIERSANHGRARLNLGKLYIRQGKLEESRIELERAAELIPEDFEVHFQLSRIYTLGGNRERATEELALYEKYRDEKEKREAAARKTPFSHFYKETP
ncbi:MAG: tetratricopeptide repeat protein, partial [Acidobacteriota bacterium]